MNLGVIGSRNFNSYNVLHTVIQKYFITWDIDNIVSGGANGADTLAERYADQYNINKKIFLADWETHGKRAGYIRNHEIWKNSDMVVAFWDGQSSGTKHSFELYKKYKKDFLVVEYLSKKVYWLNGEDTVTSDYYSKDKIPSISW